jgi:hypothetical protein
MSSVTASIHATHTGTGPYIAGHQQPDKRRRRKDRLRSPGALASGCWERTGSLGRRAQITEQEREEDERGTEQSPMSSAEPHRASTQVGRRIRVKLVYMDLVIFPLALSSLYRSEWAEHAQQPRVQKWNHDARDEIVSMSRSAKNKAPFPSMTRR